MFLRKFLRFCEVLFKLILSPFLFVLMLCIWLWFYLKVGVFSLLEVFSVFIEWFKDSEIPKLDFLRKFNVENDLPI